MGYGLCKPSRRRGILGGDAAGERGAGTLGLHLRPDRFFGLLEEDIELDARRYAELPGAVLSGRGREVVERFCREFWGTWAEYSAEPRQFIAAGDHVVVELHERDEGKRSGVPVERTHIQVWTSATGGSSAGGCSRTRPKR